NPYVTAPALPLCSSGYEGPAARRPVNAILATWTASDDGSRVDEEKARRTSLGLLFRAARSDWSPARTEENHRRRATHHRGFEAARDPTKPIALPVDIAARIS